MDNDSIARAEYDWVVSHPRFGAFEAALRATCGHASMSGPEWRQVAEHAETIYRDGVLWFRPAGALKLMRVLVEHHVDYLARCARTTAAVRKIIGK